MEQAEAEQLHNAWSDPVELEEGDQLFAYLKQLPWSIQQMNATIRAFQSSWMKNQQKKRWKKHYQNTMLTSKMSLIERNLINFLLIDHGITQSN